MVEATFLDDQKLGQYQLLNQPLTVWHSLRQTAIQYVVHLNKKRLARICAAVLLSLITLGICAHVFNQMPTISPDPPKQAFATLLAPNSREGADQSDVASDDYFLSTRVLNYQLRHSNKTRYHDENVPFLVLCPPGVAENKRQILTDEGATIVPVERIEVDWFEITNRAWGEVMAKLHLFTYTQYERVLFIDADVYLVQSLDGVFEDAAAQDFETNVNKTKAGDVLPPTYTFAGITDGVSGSRKNPANINYLNSGFFLIRPDQILFEYLMNWVAIPKSFNPALPEQNLMNDAFRPNGPMPWKHMDPKWDTSCPEPTNIDEGWKTIHSKLWKIHASPCDIDPSIGRMWYRTLGQMEAYYSNMALR
jgi:alpha-N-acetylglucosamine transferase